MTEPRPLMDALPREVTAEHDVRRSPQVIAVECVITRLIALYAQYIDFGQAERVSGLFTPDGVWESPNKHLVGQGEIREAFAWRQHNRRRRSRHVCTNTVVEIASDVEASALTYFMLYRCDEDSHAEPSPMSHPSSIGEYSDRFRCAANEWRFTHRQVTFAFAERDGSQVFDL
jgi:hypothetical protein